MQILWRDLRFGARMLMKQPGFTFIAILTLALGIGANTAIFSVINALILSPVHLVEGERVAAVWRSPKERRAEGFVSYLELLDWRSRNQSLETIAGYKPHGHILINNGQAEVLQGMRVTANFLSLLRIAPVRGRDFSESDEKRGAQGVVIISHQFWQNRLGSDDSAVGRQLTLESKPFTVIGVLPPDFEFPILPKQTDLLTTVAGEGGNLDERGAQVLRAIGRLQRGATFTQAQADLAGIAENLARQYPQYSSEATAWLAPLDEQIVGTQVRRGLWVLLGAVGFLLLIACTNVTNLLLARASVRQRELAMRVALGAATRRIARQLLTESFLLALISGGVGLLLAVWGLSAIKAFGAHQLPRLEEVRVDPRVLLFTFGAAVLTALLVSLIPIIRISRSDIHEIVKSGNKSATSGASVRWWSDVLVVSEVALGLLLLVGAGLMLRSFASLVNVSPGFDPKNVLTGEIGMTSAAYRSHEERTNYINRTLDRLRALPGVESAAFVAPMPFSGGNVGSDFRIEGQPIPEPGREPSASNRSVTPGYFQTIRIPLRKGRYFNEQDHRGGLGAAIINEALANQYFHNEDPIGKYISNIGANQNEGDPERWQIVGVIGNVHHRSLTVAPRPEIYLPYQQNSWNWGSFIVRTTNEPELLTRSFTESVSAGDRTVPVTKVQTLARAISDTTAQQRFYTLLFALFGATGLLLTMSGIYGVVSFTVTQQAREIGIRVALGAQRGDLLHLVVGHGLVLVLIGIGLGLLAAFGMSGLLQTLLFGVDKSDPMTLVAVSTLLILVALLACWIPARRAMKVDPMVALRCE